MPLQNHMTQAVSWRSLARILGQGLAILREIEPPDKVLSYRRDDHRVLVYCWTRERCVRLHVSDRPAEMGAHVAFITIGQTFATREEVVAWAQTLKTASTPASLALGLLYPYAAVCLHEQSRVKFVWVDL